MSVFFNSLSHGGYLNLLIVVAFSNSPFSSKTSLYVKNLCLPLFPDDKPKILAVCLSKLYRALFCSILLSIVLIFFIESHFIVSFS